VTTPAVATATADRSPDESNDPETGNAMHHHTGLNRTVLTAVAIAVRRTDRGARTRRRRDERGDVPGWVMITLMSAAVVALLIPVAQTQLGNLFDRAISMVTEKAG
jgi:hypothetical protein